jgi:hypothetical protein
VPRKASEVGVCKDLEGHIFTIGLGNKGKNGNVLRTSMEKITTYIGTKYGNEAAQEWTSGKKINHLKPAYSQAILDRYAARVRATREQIEFKLRSLRAEKMKPKMTMPLPIAGSSRNCNRWTTKLPRATSNSMMRSK